MRTALILLAVLLLAPIAALHADDSGAKKPNVLFVVFDDLNTRLGCYGDPIAKSPNLDRLAAQGVTFHRAYCQQPICGPSRASFMTGRRPNTLGIWSMTRYPLDCYPQIKILPEWFKEHGYTAMSIGKVFAAYSHIDRSDFYRLSKPDRRTGGARKDEFWPHDPAGKPMPLNLAKDPLCENRDLPDGACFDALSADLAIEELRDLAAKPEPFFLALGFFKPHTPYKVPKRYWDLYERDDIPAIESSDRPEGAPDLAFHVNHEIMGTGTNRRTIDAAAQREIRHGYYAAMSLADAQFGRVLDELDRLGIADDTIVVAISDNGFHLGELDTWGKMTLFRLDARVPMIIAAPMATSGGRKTSAISELVDVYPTLVDLCGLPMPTGLDGKSLVPVLRDPSARIKEAAITETPRPALYWGGGPDAEPETIGYAMHTARFTYNRWCDFKSGQPVHEELYAYSDASFETVNLATKPESAKVLQQERERFDRTIRPRLQVAPLVRKPPPPVKPVALPRRVLFEQNFDVELSDAVNARPNNTQFNAMDAGTGDAVVVKDGRLVLSRTAASVSVLNRSTPVAANPLRFFQLRCDFNARAAPSEAGKTFAFLELFDSSPATPWGSELDLYAGPDGSWRLRGTTESYSEVQTIRAYVNNTGRQQQYEGPDGTPNAIPHTHVQIWIGNRLVKKGRIANLKPQNSIRGFRFVFPQNRGFASGSVTFDGVVLESLDERDAGSAATSKPNVLFIISDDLKPLLGCYGTSWIQSPNIDRLAAKGTVFTANYCQVAFCAPTRFSLLTGLRPDSTGVYLNPDQPQDLLRTRLPDVVTLPQHFKNHGYITHPLHKVFDGRTVDQGHDAASWTVPYGPWELAPGEKPAPGGYQDPATKARLAEALKQGKPASGPATEACDIPDNAYHDGGVAHTAVKRIREFSQKEQPFFLAVGFVKPHLPFIAPQKYWDLYDRAALPLAPFQQLPQGSPHDLAFYSNSGELRAYSDIPKDGPIPEAQQRELVHGYAACVSYIDAQVGLLMQTLEECGVADDTIVCFWGDHGWHLGEHGHWGKLTNYEDAARAPLIIAAPGFPGDKRVTALTEFLNVYPTLCELAGLPIPAHVEGKSLVPLLRGEDMPLHEAVLTQMSHGRGKNGTMGWSLRTPRYRYIEWRRADFSADKPVFGNEPLAIELYDYATDPLERENLADKPEHAAVLKTQQVLFDNRLPHVPKRR